MTVGMIGTGHRTAKRFTPNPQNQTMVETAKHADIKHLAEKYSVLHRESAREWAGPCPKCGGTDRFHCTAEWWFCRDCHEKRGDAIEFVQWAAGLDFKSAIGFLTGGTMIANVQPAIPQRQEKPAELQTDDWRNEALREVDAAHNRLLGADELDPARLYLLGRGINADGWLAFRLGSGQGWNRDTGKSEPAILIPWIRAGVVRAVRYRFLQPVTAHKATSKNGSQFAGSLYGGQALSGAEETTRTLVLCEGELNAISIWQVAHAGGVDVLSLGSESQNLTDKMIEYAGKFQSVIVWMDKPQVVERLKAKLPGAVGFASPQNMDANDCLKAGTLQAIIAELRRRACKDSAQTERLLWDLYDQHNLYGGVDAPTQAIIAELRGEVGK